MVNSSCSNLPFMAVAFQQFLFRPLYALGLTLGVRLEPDFSSTLVWTNSGLHVRDALYILRGVAACNESGKKGLQSDRTLDHVPLRGRQQELALPPPHPSGNHILGLVRLLEASISFSC